MRTNYSRDKDSLSKGIYERINIAIADLKYPDKNEAQTIQP
jgi:hypothetical protein